MSEIEKAISTLEGLTLCGICTGSEDGCTKCNRYNAKMQALAALREKAERDKGCEYCNSLIAYKGFPYREDGEEIHFCKKCGRKLVQK